MAVAKPATSRNVVPDVQLLDMMILQRRDGQGQQREVKTPHFTQIGKMVTPVNSDKLCLCNAIARVIAKNVIGK